MTSALYLLGAGCSIQDELFGSFEQLLALSDKKGTTYDRQAAFIWTPDCSFPATNAPSTDAPARAAGGKVPLQMRCMASTRQIP